MRLLVLGIGNRLFGDDAVGSCIAELLLKDSERSFDVKDGSIGSLNLALELLDYDVVIFVDVATDLENEVEVKELKTNGSLDPEAHKSDPQTILGIASALGFNGSAWVVAIKAEKICFPCSPTEDAIRRGMRAISVLKDLLKKYGYELDVEPSALSATCASRLT